MTNDIESPLSELGRLHRRLDRLEAENRALRERIDEASPTARLSRRALLGGGAALGTALAAGTSTSAAAAPAFVEIDKPDNTGKNTTGLRGSIVLPGGGDPDILTPALSVWNQSTIAGSAINVAAKSFGLFSSSQGTGVLSRSDRGGVGVQGWVDGDPTLDPPTSTTSGVWGQSSYAAAPALLADADITLRTLDNPGGMPVSGDARPGDLSIRTDGSGGSTWWVCVHEAGGGEPARFVRVAAPGSVGAFEPLPAPIRVYDSRMGAPPATGPKTQLVGPGERVVSCEANTGGAVPSDALAVVVNLTIVGPSADGWAAVFADGAPWGGTSNINYTMGQNVANSAMVRCGPGASIRVRNGQPGASVDFIVDVMAFAR